VTTMTPAAPTQVPPHSRRQFRAWSSLPDDALQEREAHERIIEAGLAPKGDYALAAVFLSELTLTDPPCVTVMRDAQGERIYRRVPTFPELPDDFANLHGTERFNRALERRQADERERLDREDARKREDWQSSPLNPTVQMRQIFEELFAQKLAELDERVDEKIERALAQERTDEFRAWKETKTAA
jgi:hypothetical protein